MNLHVWILSIHPPWKGKGDNMTRRINTLLLLVPLVFALSYLPAIAEDGTPRPRGVTPEEVDPDGLEGIHAAPGTPGIAGIQGESVLEASIFVKVLLRYARVFGIL